MLYSFIFRLGKDSGGKLTPEERIYKALVAIGYPLIQCGLSTIFFVMCLLFIDTYMSEVFVKTMVLVVSLGLIHALLIVPTMLCAFSRISDCIPMISLVRLLGGIPKETLLLDPYNVQAEVENAAG
jgi:hypothetical protein